MAVDSARCRDSFDLEKSSTGRAPFHRAVFHLLHHPERAESPFVWREWRPCSVAFYKDL